MHIDALQTCALQSSEYLYCILAVHASQCVDQCQGSTSTAALLSVERNERKEKQEKTKIEKENLIQFHSLSSRPTLNLDFQAAIFSKMLRRSYHLSTLLDDWLDWAVISSL